MKFVLICVLLPLAVGALFETALYFPTRKLKRRFALPLRLIPAYSAVFFAVYGLMKYLDVFRDGTWHELTAFIIRIMTAVFALGGALGFGLCALTTRIRNQKKDAP